MKNPILSNEEKDLLESIEKDEWHSVPDLKEAIRHSRKIASETMKKDERMNIRMTKRDMAALKVKALEEGMPYQTLVSSILHKYLTGKIVEK